MAGRPPAIGNQARTKKITIYTTPEMYEDIKTLSATQKKTVAVYIVELINKNIHDNQAKIEKFKEFANDE